MYMTLLSLSNLWTLLYYRLSLVFLWLSNSPRVGTASSIQFSVTLPNAIFKGNTMSVTITQEKSVQISIAFFDAFKNPAAQPEAEIVWNVVEASGGTDFTLTPTTDEATTATFEAKSVGVYTISAVCGELSSSIEVEVTSGAATTMEMVATVIEPAAEPAPAEPNAGSV